MARTPGTPDRPRPAGASGAGRARRSRRPDPSAGYRRSFELFAETLLMGVLVAVGSLLVVTAVPSFATATAHLRRQAAGGGTSFGRLGREWAAAVRDLWVPGLTLVVALVVVAANTGLAATGALPGADAVRWVTWAAGAVAVVVHLRAAAAWSLPDGEPARPRGTGALAAGWAATRDDLTGSALIVLALGLAALLVWMYLPLVLVAGGLIALAVVGVEARRRTRPPV